MMAVKRKTKRKATPAQLRARKLFAKRAKAGEFRKKGSASKRRTVRKNPAKKKTVKKKTVKRKTVKRGGLKPARLRVKKDAAIRKAAKGRKKTLTSSQRATSANINPRRRSMRKFLIMGRTKTRGSYRYYYLKKNGRWDDDIRKAQKWTTRPACNLKMRSLIDGGKLPLSIVDIRCVPL